MSRVFHEMNTAIPAEIRQPPQVGRVAGVVHGDDGAGALGQLALHVGGVEGEVPRTDDVTEDDIGTDVAHRVRRRDERQRRADHLVARPDAEGLQTQMEGRRAVRHRHDVVGADGTRERLLELLRARPHRQPSRLDRSPNRLPLGLAETEVEEGNFDRRRIRHASDYRIKLSRPLEVSPSRRRPSESPSEFRS